MEHYPDLRNRDVLVTGGARGLGAAIVRAFHAQGARVYFCDPDGKAGRALSAVLGDGATFTQVDLRQEEPLRRWIDGIGARDTGLHALVNCPASDSQTPLERLSTPGWDALLALNLRVCFLACREAAKWMGEGSAIVNLAAAATARAPSELSGRLVSQGAVVGLTRDLARELGPRRIRVNAVSPGWVLEESRAPAARVNAFRRHFRRAQCVPEPLTAEEIASVVLFLASDASSAITGQEILADRGRVGA